MRIGRDVVGLRCPLQERPVAGPGARIPPRRSARERAALVKLLAGYLPALPPEIRAAVLAAQPASEAAIPTTGPADPAPAWKWKWVPVRDTRSYPKAPVFWSSVRIFDAPLSPSAKLVSLAVLAALTGCSEQVRIPVDRLALMTGLSTREVSVAVQELVDVGHFRFAAGAGDHGAAGGGTDG